MNSFDLLKIMQMPIAYRGQATPHLPGNLPLERWAFDPSVERARFVIVGGTFSGYEYLVKDLQEQIRRLDLSNRAKIFSHRRDVPRLMRALDVFVLPSTLPDPLPTVVLEAMAAGRPVVATAHGGALEMVLHGETGLLARYDDPAEFSQALLELADDPELRRQLGSAGRQRLQDHFSLEQFNLQIRRCVASHLSDSLAQRVTNEKIPIA